MARLGWLLVATLAVLAVADAAKKKKGDKEAVIEEVNARQLERLLDEKDLIAVFWYARSCKTCDRVLAELEKIDDETDSFGVDFVKINDKRLAKQYGIRNFPALTYIRGNEPVIFEGDLMDEDSVLDFLTSLEALDLPDRIEEVTAQILEKVVQEENYVAVLFYKADCRRCVKALQELENIDDEADQLDIAFVKIADEDLAEEYGLPELPTLVYYRNQIPIVYDGDLNREEDVLEWLVQNKDSGDEESDIDEVSGKTLETLIESVDHLVAYFYDDEDADSIDILERLENIDDELEDKGIKIVKLDDHKTAKGFGITEFPTLVFFGDQVPNLYEGDLTDEEELLEWLVQRLETDEIEEVTDEMLDMLVSEGKSVAVLFYKEDDKKSDKILAELENIDDECDELGIVFVKMDDEQEAEQYGIEDLPSLVYFENSFPSVYDGDLMKEEEVLRWLRHQLEADQIEDVTDEMLDMLIAKSPSLAVLFYDENQKKSQKALAELENIDDDLDKYHIGFVKIDNADEAAEYGIEELPALVYVENKIPTIYDGDLTKEDEVLEWLVYQKKHDEIEEITDEILDKLIDSADYLAVLFYDKDDKRNLKALNELENIDDDLDREGIVLVRIDDEKEAKEYGIENLPQLVYFENEIPSLYEGDLMNEAEVLEWLIEQKESATIEEVTDEILRELVEENEYVVVYFSGPCEEEDECGEVLEELENIDDELDESGIVFVTTEDTSFAKRNGIKEFPALALFRNKDPLVFDGDLDDEDEVLAWVTDEDNLEIEDRIEEVNSQMLDDIIDENKFVVVFFYNKNDKKSIRILNELENIDDECDDEDINFVKSSDEGIAHEYDLKTLPTLLLYRNQIPQPYTGDMMNEDAILKWIKDMKNSAPDVIEKVDRKSLQKLIKEVENLAVVFYEEDENDDDDDDDDAVLAELENIDDDTDSYGIQFVKSTDKKTATGLGIFSFPALVFYDTGVPILYDGDLSKEKEVLEWLVEMKNDASIEDIDRETLLEYIETKDFLAVIFYSEHNEDTPRILRHIELVDEEIEEYGVKVVKIDDGLMAKKYGFRNPPGIAYFRLGRHIKYDGDLDDEEEVLDWLTDPDNMEVGDHIETVNRKLFEKIRTLSDYVAVFFYSDDCKQCGRLLEELENIDDEAQAAGIDFVKINDHHLSREFGVFALPAVLFFKLGVKEPVIFAGDLNSEERILEWLLLQKDPSGDIIPEVSGDDLNQLLERTDTVAVYFWNRTLCKICEDLENDDDDDDDEEDEKELRKGKASKDDDDDEDDDDDDDDDDDEDEDDEEDEEDEDEEEEEEEDDEDSPDCKQCNKVMEELENIDDDCQRHGIMMVKTQDFKIAEAYGISEFPVLVFFEKKTPNVYEGDLTLEEDVLQWLVLQKTEDCIELVTRSMLENMVEDTQYLAALFYKQNCKACDDVLMGLENIDDEADLYGIHLVKIQDPQLAKRYSIKTLPALIYFRNGNPLFYDGDLQSEESVLEWLIDDDNRELADEIEEINSRMLDRILGDSPLVAVLFYDEDCIDCEDILAALEEIDSEVDSFGIDFVKLADDEVAAHYGVLNSPALVYFRRKNPLLFDGDLSDPESVLTWLTSQDIIEIKDEIEEVNRKMLEKLLEENDFVAVFFYERESADSMEVLEQIEKIDDETDELDIKFVKISDGRYARKWGVTKLPAIVYFRKRFPSIYRGDMLAEDEVLEWLQKNRYKQPELNIFMYALVAITSAFVIYTVFLMFCFRPHPKTA